MTLSGRGCTLSGLTQASLRPYYLDCWPSMNFSCNDLILYLSSNTPMDLIMHLFLSLTAPMKDFSSAQCSYLRSSPYSFSSPHPKRSSVLRVAPLFFSLYFSSSSFLSFSFIFLIHSALMSAFYWILYSSAIRFSSPILFSSSSFLSSASLFSLYFSSSSF